MSVISVTTPLSAADLNCVLSVKDCTSDCIQITVAFRIDPHQFVDPQNTNDPPRRQITRVQLDNEDFNAEAIMLPGGILGFHDDAGELGRRLMIVQPDGRARLTLQPKNENWVGHCAAQ